MSENGGAPRILIVEDDPAIRELLVVAIQAAGYQTSAASDLELGLSMAGSHRPDVITLDGVGRTLNFDKPLVALDTDPRTRGVPVVVVSAVGDLWRTGPSVRPAAVFRKPFDLDEVIATIARLTRRPTPSRSTGG